MTHRLAGLALVAVALSGTAWAQDKPAETNKLTPAKTIPLKATLSDLWLTPDRTWLYVLNGSEEKLQRVEVAKQEVDAATSLDLGKGELRMSPSSDGKTLYVIATTPFTSNTDPKSLSTKIAIVDAASGKPRTTFSLPVRITGLCGGTKGLLFAMGTDGKQGQGFVIDPSKKAIVNHWLKITGNGSLYLGADQKKLYFDNFQAGVVTIPANPAKEDTGAVSANMDFGSTGRMVMSPDGQYLFSEFGRVAVLTKEAKLDLKAGVDLGPHTALVVDPASKVLFLATSDGYLKAWSYPDFELLRSWNVGLPLYQLAFDSTRKLLAAATDLGKTQFTNGRSLGVGDLNFYDMGPFLESLPKK